MKTVIFRPRQQVKSEDLVNAQAYRERALDKAILDTIEPERGYAGFSISKTAATEITLTPGRLYRRVETVTGDPVTMVYSRDEAVVIDLFNRLPIVQKKRVAIVAWGQVIQTDVEPRSFKISTNPPTYQPDDVSMTSVRYCNVGDVPGVEAADPAYPTVEVTSTILGYVLLDPNGVVSIEQWEPTRVPNLRAVSNRVTALEIWRGLISAQVDNLATSLAAILSRLSSFALASELSALLARVSLIEARLAQPTTFVGFWEDWFLDGTNSMPAHAGYAARVEEGIRFPTAASFTGALALLNPSNPDVSAVNGFCVPKWTDSLKFSSPGYTGEINMSAFAYGTEDVRQLTRTRTRLRYGPERTVCTNSNEFRSGTYDAATRMFTRNGETFEVLNQEGARIEANGLTHWIRLRQVWVDTYLEPYWERVTTTASVTGAMVGQTFLWSQDAYLTGINVYATRIGASGDITVLVTETDLGQPDLTRTISRTTLARTALLQGAGEGTGGLPAVRATKHTIPPIYLKGGKRYAVVLISTGEHWLATTNVDNAVLNGTLFRSTDGGYFLGDLATDLKLDLYTAKFAKNRVLVEMAELQLAGGARDIDLLTETSVPPATSIVWEVFLDGRWQSLTDGGADLTSLPAVVRLRAVMTGTVDLMPAFGLTGSQVILSRGATALEWWSIAKAPTAAAMTVRVTARLEGYVEANHDCVATVHRGVGETLETHDVVADTTLSDGSIQRTWTFNLAASATEYKVKIVGATSNAAAPYHVAKLTCVDLA